MARACESCQHRDSRQLDVDLIAGVLSVAELIEKYNLTDSSIRRHRRNHLSASVLRDPHSAGDVGSADLLERLTQLLDDAHAVRASGLLANRADQVLRANREARAIIETLLTRMGVDDLSIVAELATGKALMVAIGRMVRQTPQVGRVLAGELRKAGRIEDADEVLQFAETSASALAIEKRTAS